MSLSSGASGGKGVDANPVETYDSGDEWDIGVGNLIIDLDADLEKDQQKLEMSGSKEVGIPAPNAVATLPDNIKFVTPVPGPQGKEGKSKSKRNKSGKDTSKPTPGTSLFTPSEGAASKKEVQGRSGDGANAGGLVAAIAPKGSEKAAKASRSVAGSKKEKENSSSKSKKERSEGVGTCSEKDPGVLQPVPLGGRGGQYDGSAGVDTGAVEPLGSIAIEPGAALNPLGTKPEPEEGENECRPLKKVKSEKMESPVSTPAVLPIHLLVPVVNNDISSPCEQIMVRTRSVGVNTCDVALATEPECLGPCEPGTSVNLEGIVWQETEDGMLVVNVTWRNKTYVGTLLDCTRHDWAPPRFCDSPTSDLEMRNGRGRGKRMRPNSNTPVNETATASDSKGTSSSSKTRAGANSKGRRGSQNSSEHRPPASSTSEDVKASPSSANKRKNKPLSDMELNSSSEDSKGSKRVRTNSMGSATGPLPGTKVEPTVLDRNCPSPVLIDCPHPNCNKKYKHINGLKYHQAHAHTDDDSKPEADGDSEYGEEPILHADLGSCNGASVSQKGSLSPARSATPKVRLVEPHSPSPSSKFSTKGLCKKKLSGEGDTDLGALSNDGSDDGPSVMDETSNDAFDSLERKCMEKEKCKKPSSLKPEKIPSKSLKSARPIAPAIPPQQIYTFQTATFTAASPGSSSGLTATVTQAMPNSPQLKPIQPKPTVMGEPFTVNPALTPAKDKKKKDKKKKESSKELESPLTPGKVCRAEEGKSPFRESSGDGMKMEGLLNGSSDPHQSRLASIKAEADKIYSFTDNAPSPSIGGSSRLENTTPTQPLTPLHVVTQNGAEASSVKTNSPAYSDISDAGEDGEGKVDSVKSKDAEQLIKEGAKKTLFPPQPQSKDSPYYQGFESYYSPSYAQSSPGALNPSSQAGVESQALKTKRDEEPESIEGKVKNDVCEEKKPELSSSSQQPSVIQQRPSMYMQSLYYNQYAYVPPYGYSDQSYHTHLLSTNTAYRQQYEEQQKRQSLEQQQRGVDKKAEMGLKEREAALKEEWKQKPSIPPTLTKAPSLTDLVKSGPGKAKEPGADPAKSVIIPKLDDSSKLPGQAPEGLKVKLSDASHLSKEASEAKTGAECGRQAEVDPILWYRQEAEPRMWTYVYPAKYSDIKSEDERWKEERDRKLKEERSRSKDSVPKEDGKESTSSDCKLPTSEESRLGSKEPRPSVHVPVSSPLTQHQSYIPYMHGYSYSQSYDPNHPSYRSMPAVMMQNYPGSYLPSSYSFSPYGSKVSGGEDADKARASPSVSCKSSSESKALDILQQHASHYKSKSPTISDKTSQERDRGGCGVVGGGGSCSSVGGASGGERSVDRPRTSPSQRLMSTHHHHHHLGYSLLPAQYNLPYAAGLSSTAIVASQQGSTPSLYPPPRR
ncbi:zinc finger protein 609 [Symphalangus syndactylus]|uniref:zinc finger protein 609 n=1 Tax=Symphalangus syndactylus TaxID=9590 RepID=UPI0024418468|nr:zinc finger protein 609 [Symphalangus syndactylus]XP_055134140.1 zinc finger protein 609 [Symphalangus syndactylus]